MVRFLEILTLEEHESTEKTVTRMLFALDIPANIKGYHYIREAILMAIRDHKAIELITKITYPHIAKIYNTTPSCVERAIRHAIEVSWKRNDPYIMDEIFNTHTVETGKRPTNSEFLATLVEWVLIIDRNWQMKAKAGI